MHRQLSGQLSNANPQQPSKSSIYRVRNAAITAPQCPQSYKRKALSHSIKRQVLADHRHQHTGHFLPSTFQYRYDTIMLYASGPSIAPVCASRKHRHYSGNRHYSAHCHYWWFPYVPSDFTGTVAGSRHYSTGAIEGGLSSAILRFPPENNAHLSFDVDHSQAAAKTRKKSRGGAEQ